jgi:hypothetical protein
VGDLFNLILRPRLSQESNLIYWTREGSRKFSMGYLYVDIFDDVECFQVIYGHLEDRILLKQKTSSW